MSTLFLRLLEAEDKGAALESTLAAWRDGQETSLTFEPDPATFSEVPGAPFAYWVSNRIRALFKELPPFESEGRTVKQGLATADDFRFVRAWWEVDPGTLGKKWFPFAKGGKYSPFYADVHLVVNWEDGGREIWNNLNDRGQVRSNVWMLKRTSTDFFFRPGLTWPLRTTSDFAPYILPTGCIFSHKGPTAFSSDTPPSLLAVLALALSRPFASLLALQLAAAQAAARSYEVGVIQRTAVPELSGDTQRELSAAVLRAWNVRRRSDRHTHSSHAFAVPALVDAPGDSLTVRADRWAEQTQADAAEFAELRSEINEVAFGLYGLRGADRRAIERDFGSGGDRSAGSDNDDPEEADIAEAADLPALSASLLEWCVGVAFGRFDIRLATGKRQPPPAPGPFGPLQASSAGMLTNEVGLPADTTPVGYPIPVPTDGILVDDPGHTGDLVRRIIQIFDLLDHERGHAWLAEACAAVGSELRIWLARSCFDMHLRRYSQSRRKAPIFWQLGTKSRSYSVWLCYPRLTKDTLYRVLNDCVTPKLRHEQQRLVELKKVAGASPSASQRRDLAAQQDFLEELRTLRAEVERVAPLWKPAMDDGVVLNAAPLWRLLGANRVWQREVKRKWTELSEGKYDWAQWAMHLWPERVVPKCATDRSLAIAHGLEDVLWEERGGGGWSRKRLSDYDTRCLIDERRSPAVQATLESLMNA